MHQTHGTRIFDSTVQVLLENKINHATAEKILNILVNGLQIFGWAEEQGSLENFADYPPVVNAFRNNGVILQCLAEEENHGWICKHERGHDIDHEDHLGNKWKLIRDHEK